MRKIVLTVPCYNEAERFDAAGFGAFLELPDVSLLFVDDGSTDASAERLGAFCSGSGGGAELLSRPSNRGKAESVREGMRHGLEAGAEIVGFVDADLATPVHEVGRLLEMLQRERFELVFGARVRVLGSDVERSAFRHYVGRVFGTLASLILRVPVYDTQCGAKFFRRSAALEAALAEPFVARWCFDVELLGRLLIGAPGVPGLPIDAIREVPLGGWRDVAGSKIRPRHAGSVVLELSRVARDLARRRREARSAG